MIFGNAYYQEGRMGTLTKVLIVEDNSVAGLVESKIVRQCNCETDVAKDGKEALDLISHEHYDLILMDIGLPDTDGLKLTQKIRSTEGENQKVPVVALTAHDDNTSHNQATWVGMNSYITKPLTIEKFKNTLKNLSKHKL